MRGDRRSWRQHKMTLRFATCKAFVFVALGKSWRNPTPDTSQVLARVRNTAADCGVNLSEKMIREALNDLSEQGFVSKFGNGYGLWWYSNERLV